MKKLILAIAFAAVSFTLASAQDYNWGVGVRLGGDIGGASVKYKFNAVNALEGIFATPWNGGFTLTALYERYIPVIDRGFHFYYGAGGHVGSYARKFSIGVDGIVGLEYKLRYVPLAFSIDYKPNFNIVEKPRFYLADLALGVRVTF
jgi:hypothetical protein